MVPKSLSIILAVRKYSLSLQKDELMEELIRKMIHDLRMQVLEKVPEYGTFSVVYERYENPDKSIALSHIILKVTAVKYEGKETQRFLELATMNYPSPYGCERTVGFGTTKDILRILEDSDESLFQKIMKAIPEMARDLEDA